MDLPSNKSPLPQAVRPLRHWSDAALERARGSIERVWSAWCGRWQLASDGVVVLNACDNTADPATAWQRVAAHPLWLSTETAALREMMFGVNRTASHTPVAQDITTQAMNDFVRSLASLLDANDKPVTPAAEAPSAADARRWSGAFVAHLRFLGQGGSLSWRLHCGADAALGLCGAPKNVPSSARLPLTSLEESLHGNPMSLSVRLQDTPLTLGSLQSMRIGDVLPLAHRLDQPLRVVEPDTPGDAPPFCFAYLGSHDTFRAVELIPAAAVPQSSIS